MAQIGILLFFLVIAILFPVVIYVGLFVAFRSKIARVLQKISIFFVIFLAGFVVPAFIFAGLAIILKEKIQMWKLKRLPSRTIGEIFKEAGISITEKSSYEESIRDFVFGVTLNVSDIHAIYTRAGM